MCDGGRVAKAPIDDEEQFEALEQLEAEHGSMADAIRYALEQAANADDATDTDDATLPKAAREGYAALREHAAPGERLGIDAAESIIAQRIQIRKATVRMTVIRKLHGAGWIAVEQGIHKVGVVIRPRTASDGGRDASDSDVLDRDSDDVDVEEAADRLDELADAVDRGDGVETDGAGERIGVSPLTGIAYAVTDYEEDDDGRLVAFDKRALTRAEIADRLSEVHAAARAAYDDLGGDA